MVELDNNMNLMNMVKKYFRNIIFSLIVTIAGGYSVHLLTKQDKPQEIKSQGNSSIVNNIKDNNGVIHNHNTTFINTILNNTTFINIIFNNTPTLPVFNLGKKAYDAFESNACVALEIIHLSNNVLYDFAKTNPRTYEFLTNTLEEDFFKSSCTK
ncbi:hypothetical protein BAZOLSSOX_1789 [uncultured Gammaproteobacteria bacterium]|nr:hypothetical protein BAZOLSSOX_1789 [uncultured Gammaproteobacteria bacterium]